MAEHLGNTRNCYRTTFWWTKWRLSRSMVPRWYKTWRGRLKKCSGRKEWLSR